MRPLLLVLGLGVLVLPVSAQAYPWMVRHNYASCGSCHLDPSGGGLLTQYGRAQTQFLLETQWTPPSEDGEASPSTGPAWGLVKPPEWLALGASFRGGWLMSRSATPGAGTPTTAGRPIQMASDLRAGVLAGPLRAGASLGLALRQAKAASLNRFTPGMEDGAKLVAREYWAGLSLLEDQLVVRAGRMNLPYGIRSTEHLLWARAATRTDTNDQQQHGLSVAYTGEKLRGELMAVLGNLQVRPASYHERGASGYAEYAFAPNLAAGVSTLVTFAQLDLARREGNALRQAHGLFARYGVTEALALMAEVDALVSSTEQSGAQLGGVGYVQADLELVRGLHLLGTVEALRQDRMDPGGVQLGGWLSAGWFFARGLELRVDGIYRRIPTLGSQPTSQLMLMSQLHVYL